MTKMQEITWQPVRDGAQPIFRQIADYICRQIARGEWLIDDRLPSQRELAKSFGVNRSTIVQAMDELKGHGIIAGNYGEGTRIVSNTWSLLASSPPPWQEYIAGGVFHANYPTIQTINRQEFAPGIIRLGTGELAPSLFPRQAFQKVAGQWIKDVNSLNYLPPLGSGELQDILIERLGQWGIKIRRENILLVSGSLQALQLISVGMLIPGSKVYLENPSYLQSLQVFPSARMELHGLQMDKEGLRSEAVAALPSSRGRAILYTIPTFHNPTGRVLSLQRRQQLLKICGEKGLPLIEDDAYRELWLDEVPPPPIKSFDHSGAVLYLGSISKALAPGLRLGWLVGPEAVVQRLGDIKMQTDYGASSLSQGLLSRWLASGEHDRYLTWLRPVLKQRRDLLHRLLQHHLADLADWVLPTGGFYIWLILRQGISTEKLFHGALEQGVLINPGNIYDYRRNTALRLSYAYAEPKELERGIAVLAELIRRNAS